MSRIWGTPETLSSTQVEAYLTRIGLDPQKTLARRADRALLTDVQVAHILHVPFDLSPIHLPDNIAGDEKYKPRGGPGMPLDLKGSYVNVVERNRGGYCFVLNGLFAALLRALGFVVSELSARVYLLRNQVPAKAGWLWSAITHMVLVADTIDEGRFVVDVGFGGGNCPFPIPFIDGAKSDSLTKNESFELKSEPLPGADPAAFPDIANGWTIYRHFAPSEDREGRTSPCCHFTLHSMTSIDFAALSFWVSRSEDSPFTKQLTVSRLNQDGSRAVLHHSGDEDKVIFYVRDGLLGKLVHEEEIPSTNAAIEALCRERFGFQ